MINIKLVDILETGYQYTKNLPLAILVGILFIFIIYSILPFTINNTYILNKPFEIIQNLNTLIFHVYSIYNLNSLFDIETYYFIIDIVTGKFIQIKTLGQGLYSYGAIWLLITSIILLLAMLSAIILSKKF
jgi:NADH-ubiquinone oxidoreductase chain 6